jgi:uncharacterized protein DUF6788
MKATSKEISSSKGYDRLKRELASLAARMGFLLTGSVQSRFFECTRPNNNCRCHDDPANRHGPYHYWTRKVKYKTVSVTLTGEQLAYVRECIETNRVLQRLLKRMERESLHAFARATAKTVDQTTRARRRQPT